MKLRKHKPYRDPSEPSLGAWLVLIVMGLALGAMLFYAAT